ncbi:unnamed protein product, partial [Mesorhabditis belari]|uniref:Serine protease n=1 Tax=Mesorhabditis belari TaxID=2138241 RepID=A0AAF3F7L5_9BILA
MDQAEAKRYEEFKKLIAMDKAEIKRYEELLVTKPISEIEVVVKAVPTETDFLIFESTDREFPYHPHGFDSMYCGQKYLQLGVDVMRQPFWKEGIVSKKRAGHFLGTSHGESGDSGSGIFDMTGRFIGISVAKRDFDFMNPKVVNGSKIDYRGVADHHPWTKIIAGEIITNYRLGAPSPKKIRTV